MSEDAASISPKDLRAAPTTNPARAYAKLIGYVPYTLNTEDEDYGYGALYVVVRDNSTVVYHDVPQDLWAEFPSYNSTHEYLTATELWNYPYEYGEISSAVSPSMLRYRRQKLLGKEGYKKKFGRGAKGVKPVMRRVGAARYTSSDQSKWSRGEG